MFIIWGSRALLLPMEEMLILGVRRAVEDTMTVKMPILVCAAFAAALWATLGPPVQPACAQDEKTPSSALQASNAFNPNISVIGWFQAQVGRPIEEVDEAFRLEEAEIAFQSVVDPYARADVFVAVGHHGVELEEAYLTWFRLPYDLGARLGQFNLGLGRFNKVHRPETPFADRPQLFKQYFGDEPLHSSGLSMSWHVPNPWVFVSLDADVTNTPEGDEVPAFERAGKEDLLYVGRLSGYADMSESANFTLGMSYANGAAGDSHRSWLLGADLTLRWKNPRRAIYRSFMWETEILTNEREMVDGTLRNTGGLYTHAQYQFARRWRVGGRYDWSESPIEGVPRASGGLGYITFTPSEFSLLSLQVKRTELTDGNAETLAYLKVTFNIGPHGEHPL